MKYINLCLVLTLLNVTIQAMEAPTSKNQEGGDQTLTLKNTQDLKKLKKRIKNFMNSLEDKVDKGKVKIPFKKINNFLNKLNVDESTKKELFDYALNVLNKTLPREEANKMLWNGINIFEINSNYRGIIKGLIYGANPNIRETGNVTPLMIISANDEISIKEKIIVLQNLLDFGADINAQDNLGMTALMYASKFNNKTIAQFLLSHKADKDIKNNLNQTASEIALEQENESLSQFIKSYR